MIRFVIVTGMSGAGEVLLFSDIRRYGIFLY